MHCQAFIDGLCATGFASAPHLQEALAEPVAHINTRLENHLPTCLANQPDQLHPSKNIQE